MDSLNTDVETAVLIAITLPIVLSLLADATFFIWEAVVDRRIALDQKVALGPRSSRSLGITQSPLEVHPEPA